MTSNYTKKQHHIPVMILKRFCDSNGKLYVHDKDRDMVRYEKPKNTGFVKHLYSMICSDKKDDWIEKQFSRIEGDADVLLDKWLIKNEKLNGKELQRIAEFAVTLMIRSPSVVKIAHEEGSSTKMADTLRKVGAEKGLDQAETERYIKDMKQIKGFSFAQTLASSFKDRCAQIFENFDPVLCQASGEKEFIIGDRYFSVLTQEGFSEQVSDGNTDWWKMPVEIICPLSKKHALIFIPKNDTERIDKAIMSFTKSTIPKESIDRINQQIQIQNDSYLYASSRELLND